MIANTETEIRNNQRRPDAGNREGENNMDTKDTDAAMDEFREWVASRKAAAATIDIETCKLHCCYGDVHDPYGLIEAQGELPEEMGQLGEIYFVSSPDSGGWVNSQDLSPAQVKAMHARFAREQARYERQRAERDDLPF
jgi:hypothetical protein